MIEKKVKTPVYIKEIYGWLYNSQKWSSFFDSARLLRILTMGNSKALVDSSLREIKQGDRVLQFGATFGDQIDKTADKVGFNGQYDLIDVNKNQLLRAEDKYKYVYPKMRFILQDAADKVDEKKYDVVLCYMLLHELPPMTRNKVVNNALSMVSDRGKVVFIDYHNPENWHPLRYFVRMFNRLYQPFAEKLWDKEIHTFAKKKTDFTWRKTTFFGRMYQKVVATKKEKTSKVAVENAKASPADKIWEERS